MKKINESLLLSILTLITMIITFVILVVYKNITGIDGYNFQQLFMKVYTLVFLVGFPVTIFITLTISYFKNKKK